MCIFFSKISAYRKEFGETKYIYIYLIKDYELVKKCKETCEKVKIRLKKEFDSEPIYNENIEKLK